MRILLAFFLLFSISVTSQEQIYELRTYELDSTRPEHILHDYLKKALLPALNRQKIINIGVFEGVKKSIPKKIYLLIPYKEIKTFLSSKELLVKDSIYLRDAKQYLKANSKTFPFKRYSTDLIKASSGFPMLVKPVKEATFFELRIYGSYNEDALRRKIKMFHQDELAIFKEVGLPVVFLGSNIAGNKMPCLTYLLAFKDKKAHDKAWSKFGPHPEWKRITKVEEYQNAMNGVTKVFLRRIPYSQL